ncbi:hypothetical protein [Nocardia beijingensis]
MEAHGKRLDPKLLGVGDIIPKENFPDYLDPARTELLLGNDVAAYVATAGEVHVRAGLLLDLEQPDWTDLRVLMTDPARGTYFFEVGTGRENSPGSNPSSLVRAHIDENSGYFGRLELFTTFHSSMVPAGIRGTTTPSRPEIDGITVFGLGSGNDVVKHWGVEHWLHTIGNGYGFKVIAIHAGKRTSLQYHREKHETYFILSGLATLHCRDTEGEPMAVDFPAGHVARVAPGAVHRVEAQTDVILIEASTEDDGSDNIRIQDDIGRGDGRVAAEFLGTDLLGRTGRPQ